MISLTKGEGFGRPLLEFSLTGKPIIATNWSGHTDFLKPNLSVMLGGQLEAIHPSAVNEWLIKESTWFKVNDGEVGRSLKEVYKKYKKYIPQSKQQKNFSKSNFSFQKMVELIDTLTNTIPDFPKQTQLTLPKLQ